LIHQPNKEDTMTEFTASLGDNIHSATHGALLLTIVSEPNRSLGDIIEALGDESELHYLMDAFKRITIGDIVESAANVLARAEAEAAARHQMAEAMAVDRVSDPDEPEPVKAKPKKTRSKKKAPTKPKPKAKAKAKKGDGAKAKNNGKGGKSTAIDLSNPDAVKTYDAQIVRFLRGSGANDEDSACPAAAIRDAVGGSPDQLRKRLNVLIEAKNLTFTGRARGTKYFLA
jgi:outer membrane biosynthesis protein TonB